MRLSVCMIVKNEAGMLEKTLPSLSRQADEIILVDTGSSDDTVKVAEKYGAKVFHFAWIDDFAAARNESLKHATGDWILWVDADELMLEEELKKLKIILSQTKAKACKLTIYESRLGQCEKINGYPREKVFRNNQGYHFIRPINEQLVDSHGKIVYGEQIPIAIYHWGKFLEEERMKDKRSTRIEMYTKAVTKDPADPYVRFLLGDKLVEVKQLAEAVKQYDKAYELAPKQEIGRMALEKKADTLMKLRQLPESARTAQQVLELDPQNISARNTLASIYLAYGKIDQAIEILLEVLSIKTDGAVKKPYQSRAWPNFLLGKAYELKGDKDKAQSCFAEYKRIVGEN